jgi:hypothetical protein
MANYKHDSRTLARKLHTFEIDNKALAKLVMKKDSDVVQLVRKVSVFEEETQKLAEEAARTRHELMQTKREATQSKKEAKVRRSSRAAGMWIER